MSNIQKGILVYRYTKKIYWCIKKEAGARANLALGRQRNNLFKPLKTSLFFENYEAAAKQWQMSS